MNITLKKLHVSKQLSEETTAFTADVYSNNKLIGYAKNDGQGGNTIIHSEYANKDLYQETLNYCNSLPPKKYSDYEFAQSLESIVDDLVSETLNAKELVNSKKKLLVNMRKGLCVGTLEHYEIIWWKGHTLETILRNPNGFETVKAKIKSIGKDKILNTNLPIEIF
jgi:hypothetical protein